MLIVKIDADINGQREGLQTWGNSIPPEGYAEYPEEEWETFYPKGKQFTGFVTFDIVNDVATNVAWNESAYQTFIDNLPEPLPEPEPMAQEEIESMLLDQEYRLLLLEYGLEEEEPI